MYHFLFKSPIRTDRRKGWGKSMSRGDLRGHEGGCTDTCKGYWDKATGRKKNEKRNVEDFSFTLTIIQNQNQQASVSVLFLNKEGHL